MPTVVRASMHVKETPHAQQILNTPWTTARATTRNTEEGICIRRFRIKFVCVLGFHQDAILWLVVVLADAALMHVPGGMQGYATDHGADYSRLY